jgi:HTH-type transcriptional regulator, transcriptional repressor of NAD biosynthesis genes
VSTFRHGLVIGKFYPPHAGHHFVIRSAAEVCERVTVVVMASEVESIPLGARVEWIRRQHAWRDGVGVVGMVDNLEVDYDSEVAWAGHVALMREAVRAGAHGGVKVDAVFTSEAYGAELARRFDAADVRLDVARATYGVSGTKVREDPIAAWSALEPPVRGWFAKRVVVLGAESTGTTTLSLDLADALRARGGPHALTRWVAEYGRELTVRKLAVARALAGLRGLEEPTVFDLEWCDADFEAAAVRQCADEDAAAEAGGPVLVCDTDALATTVWQERYRGRMTDAVWEVAQGMRPRALYILTDHVGVGFDDDGLRDGEHLRSWMTGRFREVLTGVGANWIEVQGDRASRLDQAMAGVDRVLAEGWGLAAPWEARGRG